MNYNWNICVSLYTLAHGELHVGKQKEGLLQQEITSCAWKTANGVVKEQCHGDHSPPTFVGRC